MSFDCVKGQEKPISILDNYLRQGRLSGGYLFTGAQGTGKKMIARLLAKALNCEQDNLQPCGKCSACIKIDNNVHPDVHFIETKEADIKIEYIRQLQREISLRAYEAKVKVFIIDNAHRMTAEASNALLKTLEEPPKMSLIILISDKRPLLFRTVVSRCKEVRFQALPPLRLKEILSKDYGFEEYAAHFLAYFCEGSLGKALKFNRDEILNKKNAFLDKILASGKRIDDFGIKDKEDARFCFALLASWLRDIYLLKSGMAHSRLINLDRRDDLLKAMGSYSFFDLDALFAAVSQSYLRLEQNINIKLLLYNLGVQLWKN